MRLMAWSVRLVLIATLAVAGCSTGSALPARGPVPSPSAPPVASPTALPEVAAGGSTACPVTLPVPPETIPPAAARPILSGFRDPPETIRLSMVGNEALWVVIPPDGVVTAVRGADGLAWKFLTVRLLPGRLTAQGRRLDGPAPAAQMHIPDGYGEGTGFQAFAVTFPTGGCWAITQRVAERDMRFVVQVQ